MKIKVRDVRRRLIIEKQLGIKIIYDTTPVVSGLYNFLLNLIRSVRQF